MENQVVLPDAIRRNLFCVCFMLQQEWSTDTHKEILRLLTGNYKLKKSVLWYSASLNEVFQHYKSKTRK